MTIRDKIKAKFSKNKFSSTSSSPPNDAPIPGFYTGRTDIEYYKPHEIPKSKYRGRVDKAHQDKLDAFSFGETFQSPDRRASAAPSGTFSPGGTKAFSRRTSYASNTGARTPARSRRSSLSSDANASFSVPSSESDSTHVRSIATTMTLSEQTLAESTKDDAAVTNAGLTKSEKNGINVPTIKIDGYQTADKSLGASHNHIEHSQAAGEMPFTAEDLTRAMTRASIGPAIQAC